jgi:biopolymer transport protein ExbD
VVKQEQLKPALEAALAKAKEKVVILRGDREVVLGKAVNVLDVAQEAGAKGIALATKPPGPGEKK